MVKQQQASITLVKQPTRGSQQIVYIVHRNGIAIGRIEKFLNTRTDTHPWRAYAGIGPRSTHVGAFYEDGSVPDDGDVQYGGRVAAIHAITT